MQAYLKKDASGVHRLLPRCFEVQTGAWCDVDEVLDAIRGPLMPQEGGTLPPRVTANRIFERDCSGCHVSGMRLREDVEHGRIAGGWRSTSIDCEACHGSARAHVEAWRRVDDGEPLPDLERLSACTATTVRGRCHGGSPVGSDFTALDARHLVSLPLTAHGVFSHGAASGQVYQSDAFLGSACHLEGKLACTGCHDWHAPGLRYAAHPNAICTRCHMGQAGREHTHHAADKPGRRCVDGHMPRLLTGLLAHQRDHRITSPIPAATKTPDVWTACRLDRDKAWAAKWSETWWGPPPRGTLDAVCGVHLARSGELDAARPLLEKAATDPDLFHRWTAAHWLRDPGLVENEPLPEGRLLELAVRRGDREPLRAGLRDPKPIPRAIAYAALARRDEPGIKAPFADPEVTARVLRGAANVRVVLARAHLAQQRIKPAIDLSEETLVYRPRDPDAWLVLAGANALAERPAAVAAAAERWQETTDALAHLEPLVVAAADRAGEVPLARAMLAVGAKHLPTPELRRLIRRPPACYDKLIEQAVR